MRYMHLHSAKSASSLQEAAASSYRLCRVSLSVAMMSLINQSAAVPYSVMIGMRNQTMVDLL